MAECRNVSVLSTWDAVRPLSLLLFLQGDQWDSLVCPLLRKVAKPSDLVTFHAAGQLGGLVCLSGCLPISPLGGSVVWQGSGRSRHPSPRPTYTRDLTLPGRGKFSRVTLHVSSTLDCQFLLVAQFIGTSATKGVFLGIGLKGLRISSVRSG